MNIDELRVLIEKRRVRRLRIARAILLALLAADLALIAWLLLLRR